MNPTTSIVQLVDKQLEITSDYIQNIETLSCIYIGSQNGLTTIKAIYEDS